MVMKKMQQFNMICLPIRQVKSSSLIYNVFDASFFNGSPLSTPGLTYPDLNFSNPHHFISDIVNYITTIEIYNIIQDIRITLTNVLNGFTNKNIIYHP